MVYVPKVEGLHKVPMHSGYCCHFAVKYQDLVFFLGLDGRQQLCKVYQK